MVSLYLGEGGRSSVYIIEDSSFIHIWTLFYLFFLAHFSLYIVQYYLLIVLTIIVANFVIYGHYLFIYLYIFHVILTHLYLGMYA